VPSISSDPDRRKLRWLITAFVCYFLLMVYALPRASVLPYQVFALCGLLNFAIILAFVLGIRKVYLRMKGLTVPEGVEVDAQTAKRRMGFDQRRLKLAWIGAGTYFLIFLNGLRLGFTYAGEVPVLVIILGELLNGAILTVIVLEIRKIYRKRSSQDH
jgi:hypothetical protein